jgi:son of sevenless-like protein
MLTNAPLPPILRPAFTFADTLVSRRFQDLGMHPERGTVVLGGERYVLLRSESLYLSWFDALAQVLGEKATVDLLYNAAREMGRSDAKAFIDTYRPVNEIAKLASGLVHMAHAGLASVEVLADTVPKQDDSFFFHYTCPSTFETEVLRDHGRRSIRCACFYSAGYAAGWCTEALNMHLHVREMVCKARGDDRCEFIMAPRTKLDEHYRRLRGGAEPAVTGPQKLRG